jgi:DNA-binding transcriptional ArsR family regulator
MDRVLHAIADANRRRILDLLAENSRSAGEIAAFFPDISRPAVSQHLAVLREADLIRAHKEGRRQIYRMNPMPLKDFWESWLRRYEGYWSNKLDALKTAVEEHEQPKHIEQRQPNHSKEEPK